jgi:Uma2 family endonuclease
MSSVINVTAVHYPESDGRPMGETDLHRKAMVRHIELLEHHFQGQRVYVSGDLLVYYEQGNPKKFVVPDLFVVKGANPGLRRIYKIWVEGKVPNVAIETTSKKTRRQDVDIKPVLFARIGIQEYFLFDPTQDYLDPPLQGYRMIEGKYEPIKPDANGALISNELSLRLRFEDGVLAFYRLDTGERLMTAEERSKAAEVRAAAAEAEAARLREELRRREQQ